MSSTGLMIAVGLTFVLIGLVFVPIAVKRLKRDLASRRWPELAAELIAAEPVSTVQHLPNSDDGATQRTCHTCHLTFRYVFNGETHTVIHAIGANDRAQAARLAGIYRIGERHPVFIDPEHPAQLILEHAPPYQGLWWLLPGLAFAGFGLIVILVA